MSESRDNGMVVAPYIGNKLVDFFVALLAVSFGSCFLIYYLDPDRKVYVEHGVHQLPTISLTGAYPPASAILTSALHLASFYLAYTFSAIFVVYERRIERLTFDAVAAIHPNLACMLKSNIKHKSSLKKWNLRCWYIGMLSAVCMFLTGSVPLSISIFIHSTVAFIMFVCAVIHMFFFYNNISRYIGVTDEQVVLHRLSCALSVYLNVIGIIVAAFLVGLCGTDVCTIIAVDMMPVLEFTTVVGMTIYALQFRSEVHLVHLVLALAQEPPPTASGDCTPSPSVSDDFFDSDLQQHMLHDQMAW